MTRRGDNVVKSREMYIHKAVKVTMQEDKAIIYADGPLAGKVFIHPTNDECCCIVAVRNPGERGLEFLQGWQPKASDLLERCWTVTG